MKDFNKDKKKERQSSKLEVTSSNLVGAFFTKFQFLTFLLTVSTNKPTFHVDALHRNLVYFLWHFISLCEWFVMSSVLLYCICKSIGKHSPQMARLYSIYCY